jgi:hypothetical protein
MRIYTWKVDVRVGYVRQSVRYGLGHGRIDRREDKKEEEREHSDVQYTVRVRIFTWLLAMSPLDKLLYNSSTSPSEKIEPIE